MSERASTGFPRTCSGDMYPTVPRTTPSPVCRAVSVGAFGRSPSEAGLSVSFASPKSRILAYPSVEIMMFAGLRSLWMIPAACAFASPFAA